MLLRLLAPSLLGMAVCVLTLCSLTWAWFNMSVGSSITGIQSSEVEAYLVNRRTDETTNTTTWAATTPLVANDKTTPAVSVSSDNEGKIYFIARGTAANAYLKVECNSTATYYKLDLTSTSVTTGEEYPVYSVQVATPSKAVQVSLIWGTLPESSTPSEVQITAVEGLFVSWGGTSTQYLDGNEVSNTTPVIDPSADDPQLQPETPANGDTGDNTSDANKDDAQTPDGSTTGDANKEPDATGGNTSGTGETGTSGDSGTTGNGDDTGTGGDSGTGSGENTGDVGNVTGDAIPEGGSAKASE